MTKYEQAIRDAHVPPDRFGGRGFESFPIFGRALTAPRLPTRDHFVKRFAYAIPNDEALLAIAEYAPVLEVGAGSGYWAHELEERKVDIVATDPAPVNGPVPNDYRFIEPWREVEALDAVASIAKYPGRSLLIVWPSYALPWAAEAVEAYRGDVVLYVGEDEYGCTGDRRFHDLLIERFDLEREVAIPTWSGIHDELMVWKRKP